MAARGNRIAKDQPARRDGQGHSLPSDDFMFFVAVELACKPCQARGVSTVLGTWAVETRGPSFEPDQVYEKGDNRAVELQEVTEPDGTLRRRYRLECPRCGNAPQLREDRIDAALHALYEQGAKGVTRRVSV